MDLEKRRADAHLDHQSKAIFDPHSWIEEGAGLYASSRALRALWTQRKREFRRRKAAPAPGFFVALSGYPNASFLLLGYAVEMYLKAGFLKLLRGCPESTFEREVRRFGHLYERLAREIGISDEVADSPSLRFLEAAVLAEARYPVLPSVGQNIIDAINQRTGRMWSSVGFRELCRVAQRIRAKVQKMDFDEANPSSFRRFEFEKGGYITYRIGGNLPWRIVYRASTGDTWSIDEIGAFLDNQGVEVKHYWRRCDMLEDSTDRLRLIRTGEPS